MPYACPAEQLCMKTGGYELTRIDEATNGNARSATLHDVARLAGVSASTVSRVIRRAPHVRPAVEERVLLSAAELGYRPNEQARSLKIDRSRMIGLVITEIANPFYAQCAKGVAAVVRERGYTLVLCSSDGDAAVERASVDSLARRRVEGLLLISTAEDHAYLRTRPMMDVPIVALDRPIADLAIDTVLVENRAGAYEATKHLIWHGHRRVACVGVNLNNHTSVERHEGYRAAMREMDYAEIAVYRDTEASAIDLRVRNLLSQPHPPTAIFSTNNVVTVSLLHAFTRAGVHVPDDVALIGFDDFEVATMVRPQLTVVRQPVEELGRGATELLFARIDGSPQAGVQRVVLPTELVIRESCGCT